MEVVYRKPLKIPRGIKNDKIQNVFTSAMIINDCQLLKIEWIHDLIRLTYTEPLSFTKVFGPHTRQELMRFFTKRGIHYIKRTEVRTTKKVSSPLQVIR